MTNRTDEKQVCLWMPKVVHFEARIQAAKNGMNLKEYIIHLIEQDCKNNK